MFWYFLLGPPQDTGKSFTFLRTRDRIMVQAVSRWLVTADVRVRSQANSCKVYGGPSSNGTGFTPNILFFPVSIIPAMLSIHLHLHAFLIE
jgi:hypothetical protein